MANMGSKRGRMLIRQPRLKRDSDMMLQTQYSAPELGQDRESSFQLRVPSSNTTSIFASQQPRTSLLSEQPSGSLSVPQQPPHLVKQHSHPLLPSQMTSSAIIVQRQHSQPGNRSTSRVSLHQTHRVTGYSSSLDSPLMETSASDLGEASSARAPPSIRVVAAPLTSPPSTLGDQQMSQHLLLPGSSMDVDMVKQVPGTPTKDEGDLRTTPPMLIVSGPGSSLDYAPTLRVKDELQRSISTPQVPTREFSLDNPGRSSHCPAIRPGPALGCNFCWNTIDAHGRILRRKTKYHCPECQTNLCIVPCFQEYHERQANEQTAGASTATSTSTTTTSATSLSAIHSRSTSPGRGGEGGNKAAADAGGQSTSTKKPSLKLAAFSALSSGSTNSSSPSVDLDSAGSQSTTAIQQSPDFTRTPGPLP